MASMRTLSNVKDNYNAYVIYALRRSSCVAGRSRKEYCACTIARVPLATYTQFTLGTGCKLLEQSLSVVHV